MLSIIKPIIDRFKEPSSWAVIFTTFATVGVNIPAGTVQSLTYIGAGIAGVLGFFLAEKSGT